MESIKNFIGKHCIIRTYSAGVWFGVVKELSGTCCILSNARRIWYWDGAKSLSQLAVEGTKNPQNCKFAIPVTDEPGVYLPQTIEVIPCSNIAIKSINNVEVWKK